MATSVARGKGRHHIEFHQNLVSIDGKLYGIGMIPGDTYQTLSDVERWAIWRYLRQYRINIDNVPSLGDVEFGKFFLAPKGATFA